jgi:predicted nucleic acid-binding protein
VSSPRVRSVAADSNVLLSAIAGRAARRVFTHPELIVVTTEHNIAEVEEYIPKFAARYGVPEELLIQVLEVLPVLVVPASEYAGELPAAEEFIAHRDKDDVELAALALRLRIPIWSNDRDYESFAYGTYTTAQLIAVLQV